MPSITAETRKAYEGDGPLAAGRTAARYGLGWLSYKLRTANRLIHGVTRDLDGVDVLGEDWDTLVVLDACRYDAFERATVPIAGALEARVSRGSQSLEFMERNFGGRTVHDTIYVSANPYIDEVDAEFFDVEDLWDSAWDDDHGTVLPETVTEAAVAVHDRHPHKRVIVHYMQPHLPFIGERGRSYGREYGILTPDGDDSVSLAAALNYGLTGISVAEACDGYMENLRIVLGSVERLHARVDGKLVITADHGELFGEWVGPIPVRLFGHAPGLRTAPLVTVPWFTAEHDGRREVTAEPPRRARSRDEETAEERLRSLGYLR